MLEFARWKYVLVSVVLVAACFFALPNIFGEDPALQVVRKDRVPMDVAAEARVAKFLGERGVAYNSTFVDAGRLMVRFGSVATQLAARDAVNEGQHVGETCNEGECNDLSTHPANEEHPEPHDGRQ